MVVDNELKWNHHTNYIINTISKNVVMLYKYRKYFNYYKQSVLHMELKKWTTIYTNTIIKLQKKIIRKLKFLNHNETILQKYKILKSVKSVDSRIFLND